MVNYRLYKRDRLCSRTAINALFASGRSLMGFPLRVVVRVTGDHEGARFLISIPKKRVRTAVGRVRLRRLVREAYRLHHHHLLDNALETAGKGVDLAFVFLDSQQWDYTEIEKRVIRLLERVAAQITPHDNENVE